MMMEPRYFGSVDYYALARAKSGVMDADQRFDKRHKAVHRCDIADVNGLMQLTVPIVKEREGDKWSGVRISDHGQWRGVHLNALEAAYGRTPYFEFYIDRFMPVFEKGRFETIVELDLFIDKKIRDIIIPRPVHVEDEITTTTVPYYQVRGDKLGFIPHLSVLDLIFNMGPESPLILDKMINNKQC